MRPICAVLGPLVLVLAMTNGCERGGSATPDEAADAGSSGKRGKRANDLPPQTVEHLEQCLAMKIDTESGQSGAAAAMFACQALAPMTTEVSAHLQSKCDDGDPAACHVLGDALRGERVVKHVAELVRTACGPKEDCDVLRRQYAVSAFGEATADAKDRSLALIDRACELGRADACLARSTLTKEVSGAAHWMGLACAQNSAPGCAQQVHHTMRFGGTELDGEAIKRLREMCEQGSASACASTGVLLARGVGGKAPAPDDARDLYQRACTAGSAGGCASLVYLAMRKSLDAAQRDAAAQALAKECQDGDVGPECAAAAFALHKGWGAAANKSAARAWLKKNCDAGVEAACHPPRK